jgi:hypothetical protein
VSAEVRILRTIEAALAVVLVVVLWNLAPTNFLNTKLTQFTDWWATNVDQIFSVEVVDIVDGAPGPGSTPDRIDFAVPVDSGPFAGMSPAPSDAAGAPADPAADAAVAATS